ncbi:hypothetical protein [Arthrobacter sp. zg-Y750]|uniref:hypothetical protein n=1 Tax=Arthrobacter sp. zg-Y750 TaxID=2894189 RepID=UPI001E51B2DB|nr:hypothetical protein [Arthrobacter sp. zg-Y750]MCC9179187.1 hypothetical protein [Arthrobacter sp. zg-Y750]
MFIPANPSALGRRVAVYAVPVLALTLLMAASTEDFYTVGVMTYIVAVVPTAAVVTVGRI